MNEREIRQIVTEYIEGGKMSLTLDQLKEKYPKLVAELKAEHRKEYDKAHGGSLEQAAGDQIAGKAGVKTPNRKPEAEKSEEEKAADAIAQRAGVKRK